MSTGLVLTGCMASIASGAALSVVSAAAAFAGGISASRSMGSTASSSGGSGDGSGGSSAVSRDSGGTMSREESIQAMNQLIAMFETIKEFQDSKIKNNVIIDSNSNSFLLLNELIYSSIRLIQEASFSLPMQRTIYVDRDRQIVELCCELYGSVDYLDKFIAENDFNLDEIELIPMGREVTYYVQSA